MSYMKGKYYLDNYELHEGKTLFRYYLDAFSKEDVDLRPPIGNYYLNDYLHRKSLFT